MAKLTNGVSRTLNQAILPASLNAISSPGLAAGPTLFDWADGTGLCGPGAAHVSHSATPESEAANKTSDTYGRNFDASLLSANLQSSLENRLRARLVAYGSPEYVLIWKHWDMQWGPPICALRASARRISDSDCSGWPTPKVSGRDESAENWLRRKKTEYEKYPGKGLGSPSLEIAEQLAGWPTPTAQDHSRGNKPPRPWDKGVPLSQKVTFAGWATPRTTDAEKNVRTPEGAAREIARKGAQNDLGLVTGLVGNGSNASTEKRGALNPAFVRWLMGFPPEWDDCGVMVMPSSRRSRRNL